MRVVGCTFLIFREFLVVEIVLCGKLSSALLSLSLSLEPPPRFHLFWGISLCVLCDFFSRVSLFFSPFPLFLSFVPAVLLVKSVTKGILIARKRHHHHHVSFNRCWCVPFLFVLDARSASFSFFLYV